VEQAIADQHPGFFVANSLTQSIRRTAEEAEAGYLCGPERQAISLNCQPADGQWQIASLLQHALFLGSPRDTSPEWRDWPQ
jgi:hypothetical protein